LAVVDSKTENKCWISEL